MSFFVNAQLTDSQCFHVFIIYVCVHVWTYHNTFDNCNLKSLALELEALFLSISQREIHAHLHLHWNQFQLHYIWQQRRIVISIVDFNHLHKHTHSTLWSSTYKYSISSSHMKSSYIQRAHRTRTGSLNWTDHPLCLWYLPKYTGISELHGREIWRIQTCATWKRITFQYIVYAMWTFKTVCGQNQRIWCEKHRKIK